MAVSNQFFSALTALLYNGNFSAAASYFLQDLNTKYVNFILPSQAYNQSQVKVNVFEYLYYEPKNKRNSVIQFPYPDAEQGSAITITALLAWYDANVAGHKLVKYNNLLLIDTRNCVRDAILVNTDQIVRREYVPAGAVQEYPYQDLTRLYVRVGHEIDLRILTLKGDQTIVGGEYDSLYTS